VKKNRCIHGSGSRCPLWNFIFDANLFTGKMGKEAGRAKASLFGPFLTKRLLAPGTVLSNGGPDFFSVPLGELA